jgi:hypothetical protein
MGVLDRFEKGIERAVNGAFARAFRSEVQPVEIASALRKAADEKAAVVGRGRTLVPNAYVVELGPTDHGRMAEYADALPTELANALREHAEQQGYSLIGPVTVELEEVDGLDTGVFTVRTATVKSRRPEYRPSEPPPVPRDPDVPTPGPYRPGERGTDPVASQAPSHRPYLDIDGHPYPLVAATTVLGRGEDADVVLDDPGVSRRHAEIRVDSMGSRLRATLRDLGSTNGTFVDGERARAVELVDGATITLGRTRAVYRSGAR